MEEIEVITRQIQREKVSDSWLLLLVWGARQLQIHEPALEDIPWPDEAPDIDEMKMDVLGDQLTVSYSCENHPPEARYTFRIGVPGRIWGTT